MDKKTLRAYIYEQHRQGLSDSQIAKRIGISVEELADILSGTTGPLPLGEGFKKFIEQLNDPEKIEAFNKLISESKKAPKKRGRPKKVSGVPSTEEDVKEEPKTETKEDLNWMED